jgi:hypothetical protein
MSLWQDSKPRPSDYRPHAESFRGCVRRSLRSYILQNVPYALRKPWASSSVLAPWKVSLSKFRKHYTTCNTVLNTAACSDNSSVVWRTVPNLCTIWRIYLNSHLMSQLHFLKSINILGRGVKRKEFHSLKFCVMIKVRNIYIYIYMYHHDHCCE